MKTLKEFFTMRKLLGIVFISTIICNLYLILEIKTLRLEVDYLEKVSEFTLDQITEKDENIGELLTTYYNKNIKHR